jgi:hypothetical protein
MGTGTSPQSAQSAVNQNGQLRAALLATAPRMRKNLGIFNQNGAQGGTTRVKLFNVGITTRLLLVVSATYTVGTAPVTLSPKAPYNLLQKVKLTDYDGTDRINASGFQLWVLNSVRSGGQPYGANNTTVGSVLANPSTPVAVGAQTMQFMIEVPLAFAPASDLRGALLTQTSVGEAYLNIDWNSTIAAAANADATFNTTGGGTVSNVNIQVQVYQEYLLPQAIQGGGVPIPTLDLMTVYEFAGALKSADNIAVGQEKLFNYPNVRSVIGAYFNYVNNGVMNSGTTDINKLRLIANGNNVLREYQAADKLFEQRIAGAVSGFAPMSDLAPGVYFELHRDLPIQTALYGNVQYGITPLLANGGNQYFEVGFESFYTKGSTLPGLSQTS